MKLKYNILWFEDVGDFIEGNRSEIEEFLDEQGFKTDIKNKKNGDDLEAILDEVDFNLILMDYNLNPGKNGVESGKAIINRIRKNELWTEIILYSGKTNFAVDEKGDLEGVYYATRESLMDKAKKIAKLTIKKNQDINNIRGLVIAESIEIEAKIEKLIVSYFDFDDERLEVFQSIFDGKSEVVQAKKKCDLINKISKERITSLLHLLRDNPTMEKGEQDKIEDRIKSLEAFRDLAKDIEIDVIEIRNVLAHTIESADQKNTLISRINKRATIITINDEWCNSTRKKLSRHSENLDAAFAHLK
jgi:CheY-like chemotaxis protein